VKFYLSAALTLTLAACSAPNDPAASGVTPSEAEALNDAAAMLDNNAVVPVAEPGAAGNEATAAK
jgi:hypothetical protein